MAFYKGFTPSLFLSLYGTLAMTCYECLNYVLGFESGKEKAKSFWIPFLTGAASKCMAQAFLNPLNLIRTRLQQKKYTAEEVAKMNLCDATKTNLKEQVVYDGFRDCVRKTYRNEGIGGFYKGLTPLMMR